MKSYLVEIVNNKTLIYQMTKRDILSRYKGSIIGMGWSFFTPLLMLAVYTFVFSVVFKAKWGVGGEENKASFAVILFSGMVVFNIFSECFNRSVTLITSNANYVNKIVFPLSILPITILLSSLFHAAISLVILLLASIILMGEIHFTLLLLPVVWLPYLIALVGMMLILSSVGVYLRDLAQITGVLTTILMFTSPLFFPRSALPMSLQPLLMLNPLAYFIEVTRDVIVWGKAPQIVPLAISYIASLMCLHLGYICFEKLRKGFSDVI
ncbi:ABC transporter permease [Yersinia sp. 2466 StPb PI]|uniref:ABC transporter permease n=1 Tax=unclassified Yersinia (in: enterobacteria) TaxID=2653513 RepID=UPI00355C7979